MRKNKKIITIFLALIICIIPISTTSIAELGEINNPYDLFNEYGFKVNTDLLTNNITSMSVINDWEYFPSKSNTPLDKVWTVKFSSAVSLGKIDAIVIERNNEFIPVKIQVSDNNEIQVSPTYGFSGSTSYNMKIFLANGKKYKMNFTTVPEPRNSDIEPNDTYLNAKEMYLNETLIGSFSEKDRDDYYKIEIPRDGRLDLTAIQFGGGQVDLYVYGPNGSDKSYIRYTYDKTTATTSAGLGKGTYYIRVNYSGYYGNYTLENKFTEDPYKDDNGTANYISANELELNNTITGHIGYIYDYNNGNYNDYFKIIIPEDGILVINAKQLGGGELDMYLYGATGPDRSYIKYVYDKTAPSINVGLAAGIYYLRLNDSGYYGAYELDNKFYTNVTPNDSAPSNYIQASEIALNETTYGHIGYTYDTTEVNQNDYYKIVLEKSGTLKIEAAQLDGGELDLYLYGSTGTDASYISYIYNKAEPTITKELSQGTYYIRINYSGHYGGYEIITKFN